MSKGIFITIEGAEGAGKSTALNWIASSLTAVEKNFILTREPGGTAIAEKIREVLLTKSLNEAIVPETELLLMFACRVQHVNQIIRPALQQGQWVVCDRFFDASYAYQGSGRGIDQDRIEFLVDWLVPDLMPDRTILLDVPAEIGLARAKQRNGGAVDRIEQENIDFHQRVRQGYLDRATKDPKRFRVIDAGQPLLSVRAQLEQILNEL